MAQFEPILLANINRHDSHTLSVYESTGGYRALRKALAQMQPVDVVDVVTAVAKAVELGGTIALPKMPIPTMGWLAYGKDTEGNLFGMMAMDPNAK